MKLSGAVVGVASGRRGRWRSGTPCVGWVASRRRAARAGSSRRRCSSRNFAWRVYASASVSGRRRPAGTSAWPCPSCPVLVDARPARSWRRRRRPSGRRTASSTSVVRRLGRAEQRLRIRAPSRSDGLRRGLGNLAQSAPAPSSGRPGDQRLGEELGVGGRAADGVDGRSGVVRPALADARPTAGPGRREQVQLSRAG